MRKSGLLFLLAVAMLWTTHSVNACGFLHRRPAAQSWGYSAPVMSACMPMPVYVPMPVYMPMPAVEVYQSAPIAVPQAAPVMDMSPDCGTYPIYEESMDYGGETVPAVEAELIPTEMVPADSDCNCDEGVVEGVIEGAIEGVIESAIEGVIEGVIESEDSVSRDDDSVSRGKDDNFDPFDHRFAGSIVDARPLAYHYNEKRTTRQLPAEEKRTMIARR